MYRWLIAHCSLIWKCRRSSFAVRQDRYNVVHGSAMPAKDQNRLKLLFIFNFCETEKFSFQLCGDYFLLRRNVSSSSGRENKKDGKCQEEGRERERGADKICEYVTMSRTMRQSFTRRFIIFAFGPLLCGCMAWFPRLEPIGMCHNFVLQQIRHIDHRIETLIVFEFGIYWANFCINQKHTQTNT